MDIVVGGRNPTGIRFLAVGAESSAANPFHRRRVRVKNARDHVCVSRYYRV